MKTKSKISGYIIRSGAWAVLLSVACIALSSALKSPNKWDKSQEAHQTDAHGLNPSAPLFAPSDTVHEAWVARYNGPGSGQDFATAMVVDSSGNVYVTGASSGSGTDLDYATIKYNSAGQQQWIARYNGPGNSTDVAFAIAIDAVGNVYVTGNSVGSDIFGDYATIKYNSAGQQQWVARYDGPGHGVDNGAAIAVDVSGNVYVTGDSYGLSNSDYATIKYNSAGQEQWVARYDTNFDDYGRAIAVDQSGNVYVTGASWRSGYDYATVKYNSAGQQQWVARYDAANYDDEPAAIAVDGSGNTYVTGQSTTFNTSSDYATIKYNPTGQQEWVTRYAGPGNASDGAHAMAVDSSGNVYVTGGSSGNYATIKYNSAGEQQWVAQYNPAYAATAIAIDTSGNVYVTGGRPRFPHSEDYATIKYNSVGQQQWVGLYNGPGNSTDHAAAIALDALGNVYVTGYSVGSGTSADYATIKYVQEATPTPTPTSTFTAWPTITPRPPPTYPPRSTLPPRPTASPR